MSIDHRGTVADIMARLADLVEGGGPNNAPSFAEINRRLGTPAGFFETAAAFFIAMQHDDPDGFLATAAALHRMLMTGQPVVISPPEHLAAPKH